MSGRDSMSSRQCGARRPIPAREGIAAVSCSARTATGIGAKLLLGCDDGPARDLLAGSLRQVDPLVAAVRLRLAGAGVLAVAAVVLARLGDAGAFFHTLVVIGGD